MSIGTQDNLLTDSPQGYKHRQRTALYSFMETASSGRTAVVLTHLSERGIEALQHRWRARHHGVASGWWAVMMEDPFKSVRDQVRSELDMSASINNSELMARIEEMVWRRRELMELTAAEKRRLVRRVFDSFAGWMCFNP